MIDHRKFRLARVGATVLGLGAALLVAACSSSTSSTPSPVASHSVAAGSPAANKKIPCQQITALRTSLTGLTTMQLSLGSAAQIGTELKTIQTQLAGLKGQASGSFSTEASQLQTALKQVETTAKGLVSNPSTRQLRSLKTALADLKHTVQPLVTQMKAVCP